MRRLRNIIAAWLFAALAVAGQLSGAMALPEIASAAPLGVICSAGHTVPDQSPVPHQHHDCALCPACAAIHLQAVALDAAPAVPMPSMRPAVRPVSLPPPRAPPSHRGRTPPPRGPPAFA